MLKIISSILLVIFLTTVAYAAQAVSQKTTAKEIFAILEEYRNELLNMGDAERLEKLPPYLKLLNDLTIEAEKRIANSKIAGDLEEDYDKLKVKILNLLKGKGSVAKVTQAYNDLQEDILNSHADKIGGSIYCFNFKDDVWIGVETTAGKVSVLKGIPYIAAVAIKIAEEKIRVTALIQSAPKIEMPPKDIPLPPVSVPPTTTYVPPEITTPEPPTGITDLPLPPVTVEEPVTQEPSIIISPDQEIAPILEPAVVEPIKESAPIPDDFGKWWQAVTEPIGISTDIGQVPISGEVPASGVSEEKADTGATIGTKKDAAVSVVAPPHELDHKLVVPLEAESADAIEVTTPEYELGTDIVGADGTAVDAISVEGSAAGEGVFISPDGTYAPVTDLTVEPGSELFEPK